VAKYVVDTSLYIDATHLPSAAEELKSFYARFLPSVHLHSVIAQEILLGALDRMHERDLRGAFIEPFEGVGRVITPLHSTWMRASVIALELIRKKKIRREGAGGSFFADCLIAASAREHDFVLVTRNARDFALIQEVEMFSFVQPWPTAGQRS
jgi:predicted nucleic acid-binding protein